MTLFLSDWWLVTPTSDYHSDKDDIKHLTNMLELERNTVTKLREYVFELRGELSFLSNIIRREATKPQKLGCEALTVKFCFDLSEVMNEQTRDILSTARRNYARLAWKHQQLTVDNEVNPIIERANTVLMK